MYDDKKSRCAVSPNRYVGITGFMCREEVDYALSVLPNGLKLMCGVLVSQKSFVGERNKWRRRYPAIQEIKNIFSDDPRCLNLIHYSTSKPMDAFLIAELFQLGGRHLHGFQFNGVWPEPHLLSFNNAHVVLQVRPPASERWDVVMAFENTLKGQIHAVLKQIGDCHVHVLIDASGGRGLPIEPTTCQRWAHIITKHFPGQVHIGFAGGLAADSLPRVDKLVQVWDASIDAEGRLRDGDEGGTLNFDKVREYLAAAGRVMLAQKNT